MVAPKPVVLRKSEPRIVQYKHLISKSEIKHLLKLANGHFKTSTVVDNQTGGDVLHQNRTGEFSHLGAGQDQVVQEIEKRLAVVTDTRVEQGESIQVIRYRKGQEYKPHYDWFDPALPGSKKQLQFGGQRILTAIMCLEQAEKGGETSFPNIGLTVKLEPGDVLLFSNLTSMMLPDKQAMHSGDPVKVGVKTIATRWIRERAASGLEEEGARREQLKKQRETECYREIGDILRKHGCKLYGKPRADVDPSTGVLVLGATVELEAIIG